ncbi:MAG: DNA polymerase IV, partial [Bacilli bacterium]
GHLENNRKGIVLTASYEARKYGIHAAMPLIEAMQRCRDLIIVEPDMHLYADLSKKFFNYFYSITPLVEPASIDEGYLDVTDVCAPSLIVDLAKDIQNDLLEMFNLPCSIGIAPNKFLAKMASDMKKPQGITILRKRDIDKLMWPLPISDMFGIGKRSLDNFKALGIKTIGDLANYQDKKLLEDVLGKASAESLYLHANGYGSNVIDVNRYNEVSSISNSQTLDHDEYDTSKLLMYIKILTNSIANRLEKNNLKAYTFTLQIKYANFKQYSKSITLQEPLNDNYAIYHIMHNLFEDLYDNENAVRLLGVGAAKLIESQAITKQYTLFDNLNEVEKEHEVEKIINGINNSLGQTIIARGINKIKNNKDE